MSKKLFFALLIFAFFSLGAANYIPTTFNELDDVNTTGIATGKIPKWNAVTSKWEMSDDAGAASGAPTDATYITQTANGSLSAEQALSGLATGLLKNTNGTGVLSIAADGTDYLAPSRIDDTKGNGDTGYVWSADKVFDQLALKQAADADLTTYAGITPTANAQTLLGETFAQMQASLSVDDLITLSGVAEGSANLGTFTGTTIPDNQNNKEALQALETAVETKAPTNNAAMTGTFGIANNINISGNKHKWIISIKNGSSAITTPYIIPIGFADAALTVTQVKANTSSASYEITGDLKYADARIGLANATVVNDFDTTSGVRTDTTITSAAIASGKFIYILFDAAPNASDTDDLIEIEWDYDA